MLPAAYALGTFPSAELTAKASGIDITAVGSGNPGASNVTRALGWRKGLLVFAADAAKGAAAAAAGLLVGGSRPDRPAAYALGAAAIVGHVYPITRSFRGGKGVATGAGVMVVLHPLVSTGLAGVWLATSQLAKRASPASIAVIALLPVGLVATGAPPWEFGATTALCALVMARHAGNLRRLWRGKEPQLSAEPTNS